VALMQDGRLRAYGTPEELYERPRNLFVAEFIGNPPMNFLPVELTRRNGVLAAVSNGLALDLPEGVPRGSRANGTAQAVTLGIRPEDLTVEPPGRGHVRGEIYVVEPMGREQLVEVRIGVRTLQVIAPPSFSGQIGDAVGIGVNADRLHLFDPDSGERLH